MSDSRNLNAIDVYNAIRNFGSFLRTDVKVSGVTIDCVFKGSDAKKINVPGFTLEVEISNMAPVETSYPLIVFMGVGLRVKFPETIHRTITGMRNESNFEVDETNAPQTIPLANDQTIRTDGQNYPPITPDEKKLGYVLFPGQSIKYKFSLMDTECPDVNELKLYAEGTVSRRHLLHHVKEIPITSDNIIYQL